MYILAIKEFVVCCGMRKESPAGILCIYSTTNNSAIIQLVQLKHSICAILHACTISSTAFSFYLEFYIYSILFRKILLQKPSLPFFNNLKNQTTFLLFLLKFKGSIHKSPHTASLQVFEEQPKIFLHAANNTASNALDWDVVHLHTSLPYSNDGQRMDKITCLLTYKLKHGLFKILKRLLTLRLPAVTSSLICVSQCPLYINFTPK